MNASATEHPIRKADPQAPIALVIGGGFGGLAAATRLCAKGYRVIRCKINAQGLLDLLAALG